jgi:hypothetical protein
MAETTQTSLPTDRMRIMERALDDAARQIQTSVDLDSGLAQRAVTLASVYIATATAIVAALVLWKEAGVPEWAGGIATAIAFYVGGALCIGLAFPVALSIPGNPPEFWTWHMGKDKRYEELPQQSNYPL